MINQRNTNNNTSNKFLYESNDMYWGDFEGGNYDNDIMYMRSNINYEDEKTYVIFGYK